MDIARIKCLNLLIIILSEMLCNLDKSCYYLYIKMTQVIDNLMTASI